MKHPSPHVLVIMDGFGHDAATSCNAIACAPTPFFDKLWHQYPHTLLKASGSSVGLPSGIAGNSEVGHEALGAGRVVKQPSVILNQKIKDGTLATNTHLQATFTSIKKHNGRLHLIGLLSDGYVHSHTHHLYALLHLAHAANIESIFVHPILDGRDSEPYSALSYLTKLQHELASVPHAGIGSISGRFYAMDRDNQWQRTKDYVSMLTSQQTHTNEWKEILEHYYAKNITDEFIPPTRINSHATIADNDGVIIWNYRPDRSRQLVKSILESGVSLSALTIPVSYGTWFDTQTTVLFPQKPINNTFKEILAEHGKTIVSIAETEKYAHVTYFFGGGKEEAWPTERQILIPSLGSTHYETTPRMSADVITQTVIDDLTHQPADFYLINYANADMIGHTGNLSATIDAIACLDQQLEKLVAVVVKSLNGTLYITSDHGNAEYMCDPITKQIHPEHTTNLVPFIIARRDLKGSPMALTLQSLCDVAPFILKQMGIPIPYEMN